MTEERYLPKPRLHIVAVETQSAASRSLNYVRDDNDL